jgi:hypothetical protein
MKVTCMQLDHPSLTKVQAVKKIPKWDSRRRSALEERGAAVWSDLPIFSHAFCRLAAPCCVVHGQKVTAASTREWEPGGGQARSQLRTGLGVCGSVTAHGFNKDVVARCGVVGKRGTTDRCSGAMRRERGEVRNGLQDPYPLRHLGSSPSVWQTAAQCPPSRRTQAAMTNQRSPCGRCGSWNRQPGCE